MIRVLKASLRVIGLLLTTALVCPAQVTFTTYSVPTVDNIAEGITAGPDGNLWFIEHNGNQIWKMTMAGVITGQFSLPIINNGALYITAGPDGNLWFQEYFAQRIGRITPAGVITEFPLPNGGYPFAITAGPDGNLWFTERFGHKIGRITPAGVITEFPVPASGELFGITAGPDGNLWFTQGETANKIGRITPNGVITQFPAAINSYPYSVVAGPDGNLWFTEARGNKIGRITPTGVITEFPLPTANSLPIIITAAPDGNLWFTENAANKIGRITPAGVISEFSVTVGAGIPLGLTTGPDSNLWFTDGNKVVKATIPGTQLTIQPTTGGNAGTVTAQIFGSGFQNGSTVKLTGVGNDILGTNTAFSTGPTLTTTFNLTAATPGLRTLVITNPDNTSMSLPAAFTVQQGGAPQIWVDIVGRDRIRADREQTYYVVYGNSGNIDMAESPIWVSFPASSEWRSDSTQQPGAVTYNGNTLLSFDVVGPAAGWVGTIPLTLKTSSSTSFQIRAWSNEP